MRLRLWLAGLAGLAVVGLLTFASFRRPFEAPRPWPTSMPSPPAVGSGGGAADHTAATGWFTRSLPPRTGVAATPPPAEAGSDPAAGSPGSADNSPTLGDERLASFEALIVRAQSTTAVDDPSQPQPVDLRRSARKPLAEPAPSDDGRTPVSSPGEAGLPVFPGATLVPEESSRVSGGRGGDTVTVLLSVQAPLSSVISYYQQAVPLGLHGEQLVQSQPSPQGGLDLLRVDLARQTLQRVRVASLPEAGAPVLIELTTTQVR